MGECVALPLPVEMVHRFEIIFRSPDLFTHRPRDISEICSANKCTIVKKNICEGFGIEGISVESNVLDGHELWGLLVDEGYQICSMEEVINDDQRVVIKEEEDKEEEVDEEDTKERQGVYILNSFDEEMRKDLRCFLVCFVIVVMFRLTEKIFN